MCILKKICLEKAFLLKNGKKGENMNVKMLKIKDKLNYESVGIFAGQNKKKGGHKIDILLKII